MRNILILIFGLLSFSGSSQIAAMLMTEPEAAGATYLLDDYPAAAAYSLRLLKADQIDSAAIRVRRSSDNAEQDIGFTSEGYLDTASLKTFVGANDGLIVTWYDQSGNEYDATQGTAASQPRIVNSGVIERMNGEPCIYSHASGVALDTDVPFNGNKWGFSVLNIPSTNAFTPLIGSKGSNLSRMVMFRNGTPEKAIDQYYSGGFAIRTNSSIYTNNTDYILSFSKVHTSATNYFYLNGTELTYLSRATRPDYTSTIQLFNSQDQTGWDGIKTNFISLYTTDQSSNRSSIETYLNTMFSIY